MKQSIKHVSSYPISNVEHSILIRHLSFVSFLRLDDRYGPEVLAKYHAWAEEYGTEDTQQKLEEVDQ